MEAIFKILLYTLGFIVLLVGAFVLYIQIKGIPNYPVEMTDAIKNLKVTVDSAHIAEGKRISSCFAANATIDRNPKTHRLFPAQISQGIRRYLFAEYYPGQNAWHRQLDQRRTVLFPAHGYPPADRRVRAPPLCPNSRGCRKMIYIRSLPGCVHPTPNWRLIRMNFPPTNPISSLNFCAT